MSYKENNINGQDESVEETLQRLRLDIAYEKRQRKILLICSLIGLILGIIIGVIVEDDKIAAAIAGLWVGTGLGGALTLLPAFPATFIGMIKENGLLEGIKTFFIGLLFWFIIFWVAGPIGLLVRVLKINFKIVKYQRKLKILMNNR